MKQKLSALQFLGLTAIALAMMFFACSEEPIAPPLPPLVKKIITLASINVTSKEITFKVTSPDSSEPRSVKIMRDGQTLLSFKMQRGNTLITDDGLDANREYKYQALRRRDSVVTERSDTLRVTTTWRHPRDYVWTIDTLSYPGSFQTTMKRMYAASAKDIYVVGHNEDGGGKMYHYDGKGWKPVGLSIFEGGYISGSKDLWSIHGFGSNNIYAVGERIYSNDNPPPNFLDSSIIIHFDGTKWTEVKIERARRLTTVWDASPMDIWAGGSNGTLYHFDGTSWKLKSFDTTMNVGNFFGLSATHIYASVSLSIDRQSPSVMSI